MPTYQVGTPDGKTLEYTVPDGVTQEDVLAHAQADYKPDPSYQAPSAVKDASGRYLVDPGTGTPPPDQGGDSDGPAAPDTRPTSFWRGVKSEAGRALLNTAKIVEEGADNLGIREPLERFGQIINPGAGTGDVAASQERFKAQVAAAPTQGSGFGNFVGDVVGTLPLAALPGGAIAQGFGGGAVLADDQSAGGRIMGGVTGAAGGKLGEIGLNALGRVAAPVVSDGLRTLVNEGVRVTPGQIGRAAGGEVNGLVDRGAAALRQAGAKAARQEDLNTSLPFVGDAVNLARDKTMDDFGRAAINRAVGVLTDASGKPLAVPENLAVGRRAVEWAGNKLSNAYDDLLPKLSATGDTQFTNELSAIHSDAANEMLPARAEQFNNILNGLGRFWQNGTTLDGTALKAVESRITRLKGQFQSSGDADQKQLGDALEAVQESLRDLVERQNPQYADELRNLNKGWKSLVQVERASTNSKGAITPAGYSQAVKFSSDTLRRRGYARGQALNQDLADAASEILPSGIPDSGTAPRALNATKRANVVGAVKGAAFKARNAASPIFTRQQMVSPALRALLAHGARLSPAITPALINNIEQR